MEIEALTEKPDEAYAEREQFESQFFMLVSTARLLLSPTVQSSGGRAGSESAASTSCGGGRHDFVRLPKIDLPHFDGNYQHWLGFRDTYISLIHNNPAINDISKFHYLRASLKSSAALVIQSLDFSSDNYHKAWQLVSERYDNPRLLINNHIQALFNLEPMQHESSSLLRNMVDVTNKNLRALGTLGEPTDHWDTLVIYIMSKKLDLVTKREWEEHRNLLTGSPTLQQYITFLNNRADLLESLGDNNVNNSGQKISKHKFQLHSHSEPQKTHNYLTTTNSYRKPIVCPYCKHDHFLFTCESFRKLDVDSRIKNVNTYSVCKNCLRPGHLEKQCVLSHCKYCKLKHNTLLHKHVDKVSSSSDVPVPDVHFNGNIQTKVFTPTETSGLLSTALVHVSDANGVLREARLLLDNGASSNFVTRDLCRQLGLATSSAGATITGINEQLSHCPESCNITIQSLNSNYTTTVNCYVAEVINKSLPPCRIDLTNIPIPAGITLADPSFYEPSAIDILVGAEVFWDVLGSANIKLGKNKPQLRETSLGWIVCGSIPAYNTNTNESYFCSFLTHNEETNLTRFWELDSVSSKHCMSQEEQACEKSFLDNTTHDQDGRFVVTLPLKESPDVLGDSYQMAKRRFLALEKRLARDPVLKNLYFDFIREYIDLGHMSENQSSSSSSFEPPEKSFFFPHHGILRSNKSTPLRVVYDGSAITTSGKSFNEIQMVGPTVQDDLLSILLRFRQHKYVVSSDVEKMYRAILVQPSQRSLQQIIFRFDPSDPLKTYKLNTVTYGTACAPYLATKCLVSLADECQDVRVKRAIQHDFYVDDFLSGSDSVDSLVEISKGVVATLESAKFNLRKWQSNCPDLLKSILEHKEDNSKALNLDSTSPSKTLGLYWQTETDKLLFSIDIKIPDKITKRNILSVISQVFDPLGLVGPCIVEAKIILQRLWLLKCEWDSELPLDIKNEFISFASSLANLNKLKIDRWVFSDSPIEVQVHVFTDASERAYGTSIYVRTVDGSGAVCVRLIASKNKVSPLKPSTIPRLELCGALLGARLWAKVISSLTVKVDHSYFWSDSMIVLGWLAGPSNRLKPFVRNRVNEIQESTRGQTWSYVPSKLNPADLVSRGMKADDLSISTLWWTGPDFLHHSIIQFPMIPNTNADNLPEVSLHTNAQANINENDNLITKLITNNSKLTKLIRIVAYIYRFIHNCKNKNNKTTSNLTYTEIKSSKTKLLQLAQQESFPEDYKLLSLGKPLQSKSRLLSLTPFLDDQKLIRVGGRLNNAYYSYDIKHPILLCSRHHLTKLLFDMQHMALLHAPPQLLLASVRQKYYPLGGRNLARHLVYKCVRCIRFKARPFQVSMGNLPIDRTQLEYPFLHTGMDFAGPVLIADRKGRGSKTIKSYILVFVCLAVKALHLELVTSLTTESFLAALRRFMSRRGKPQTLYCDNGTSFVGASNELSNFLKHNHDKLQSGMAENLINFKFSPAYSPHFGGLWEAAVKSTKYHLKRILSLTHLTYEELNCCLIQIEAILNSRPLTPLSSDPSDLTYLSPSHFLIGRSLLSVPQEPLTEENISRLERFQRVEKLKQHFWSRFSNEYVTLLQHKTKWHTSTDQLQVGTMVLVKDRALPPLLWLLGRVTKLYPGTDNVTRVADIRTKKGVIRRAYNNLCPLPIT
ncbi:uncharacterized protein LOC133526796 [Cydia pomonella]|uniref:uncharacterized protein LOC133526796 n=1 Tax=Cydia pomonella TaxID=82600 RepID=UPI002ADD552C|nr:uncharacterized protein LOC133526796 [Cydia pomonella]